MSINSYLQKCSYKIGGLNKHIYLVDKKDMTISIEANRTNVLFKLKENSIVYKMQCDLVTYRQESSTYSKYRFKNILTVLLTESKNNPNFYVLDKLRKNNYYIIFEDKKGNQYLSNPELFTKLYYEYTFNNDGNVCELNFENLTNFPLLIASKNITSNELLNEKKCDYNYGIPQKLYIANKEKMLITSDNVKASSVYAEKLETVDFLENSLTLVEKYENNVFTTSLKFSIQLDDNQFNWHYNLLEYSDNVYSCILYTTNKNYIIFGTDGMIPQIDIETSDEDENLNIINIKLTQTSQYPMLYSDSLTNKKWVFEGNTRCIGFDKYEMLKQYTSNDEGKTWKPTTPEVLIKGKIIEKNSEECYISEWREDGSECRIRNIHFEDWRVVPNEYICEVGRKYEKTQKYVSSEGNNWDATDEYGKGSLLEEYSNDCAYVSVRWVEDNRTTCKEVDETKNREVSEEICISLDLYNKWNEEVTADGINFYPSGKFRNELIEKNSLKCGYVPEPQYQWINRGYVCEGYDKHNQEYEQVSHDGGLTWKDTGRIRIGSLVEANSLDCGYIAPYDIAFNTKEPNTSVRYLINGNWQNCITDENGHYEVNTRRDLGITEITEIMFDDNPIISFDVRFLDVSKIKYMSGVFSHLYDIEILNLSTWKTDSLESLDSVFESSTFKTIDLSNFNTSNLTNFIYNFYYCENLETINLSNLDLRKVKPDKIYNNFDGCNKLTSITMDNCDCETIEKIKDQLGRKYYDGKVIIYSNTGCEGTIPTPQDPIYEWIKRGFQCDGVNKYERECEQVSTDGGKNWLDTGKYRNGVLLEKNSYNCGYESNSMSDYDLAFDFTGDNAKYTINDTHYTASTSPYYTNTKRDLGIDKITSMEDMLHQPFSVDNNITAINRLPLTKYCIVMNLMFSGCSKVKTIDVSKFDTSNCSAYQMMFAFCKSLTSLNVSGFRIPENKASSFDRMFEYCESLISLDLSSWNLNGKYEKDFREMFLNCKSLVEINLSGWNMTPATASSSYADVFKGCTSLKRIYARGCPLDTIEIIKNCLKDSLIPDGQVEIITQ